MANLPLSTLAFRSDSHLESPYCTSDPDLTQEPADIIGNSPSPLSFAISRAGDSGILALASPCHLVLRPFGSEPEYGTSLFLSLYCSHSVSLIFFISNE